MRLFTRRKGKSNKSPLLAILQIAKIPSPNFETLEQFPNEMSHHVFVGLERVTPVQQRRDAQRG